MLQNQHVIALQEIVGIENSFTTTDKLREYGHDETEDLVFRNPLYRPPPITTNEVSQIMQYCFAQNIPVTSRRRQWISRCALPLMGRRTTFAFADEQNNFHRRAKSTSHHRTRSHHRSSPKCRPRERTLLPPRP